MSTSLRRETDSGEIFDLTDSARVVVDPWHAQPYAHNPRLDARLPRGATVGGRPRVHSARHRAPGVVQGNAPAAATFAATPGDVFTRPADSSEALEWRELIGSAAAETPLERAAPDGLAFQLVRIDVPLWGLAVVERIATYLRAQALDENGEPVGDPFVTDCCTDPFAEPVHPTSGAPLRIRWTLAGMASTDPTLVGLSSSGVPTLPIQIQPHWSDLRFAYGARYTEGLKLEVPTDATSVRLFATVPTTLDRWTIRVGGRLAVWWIPTGPRAAALRAATRRI